MSMAKDTATEIASKLAFQKKMWEANLSFVFKVSYVKARGEEKKKAYTSEATEIPLEDSQFHSWDLELRKF